MPVALASPSGVSAVNQVMADAVSRSATTAVTATASRLRQIASLIDLTSLNDADISATAENLCQRAMAACTAAVCIYPRLVADARKSLDSKKGNAAHKVRVATVVNFPTGNQNHETVLEDTRFSLQQGADEIDVVFPYHELVSSSSPSSHCSSENRCNLIRNVCELTHAASSTSTCKVILESGLFDSEENLRLACMESIRCGADFLKTSTGKVAHGADLNAAWVLLDATKKHAAHPSKVGVKISGGVRTVAEAENYLRLAELVWETDCIDSSRFRFGASGLLDAVMTELSKLHNSLPNIVASSSASAY